MSRAGDRAPCQAARNPPRVFTAVSREEKIGSRETARRRAPHPRRVPAGTRAAAAAQRRPMTQPDGRARPGRPRAARPVPAGTRLPRCAGQQPHPRGDPHRDDPAAGTPPPTAARLPPIRTPAGPRRRSCPPPRTPRDTRQKRIFGPSAAMHKHTAWMVALRAGHPGYYAADGAKST